jgi:crotonobetaine/carnitine-CoA ligase
MSYEVQLVDEHDAPVPVGDTGEIVVRPKRPDTMFTEYHRKPEATVDAFRNLWFHTGDRGRMDSDGFVFFVDRLKDSIRRRGENISTWEIESTVNLHETVMESAAYGVESELTEQDVMVSVAAKPGQAIDPASLVEFCHGKISRFAVPRYVRVVGELPKNHAERVQKFKLREIGVTADTWDAEAQS